MFRLGLISCLGATLALPGCIVTYGLGETADETLRLVLDWWGMGWNGWILMQQINTHQDTIDLVNAEYESTWAEQVGTVLGDPWRTNLSVGVVEDECNGPVGKCGDQPRALSLGIGPDSLLTLHEGQEGTMSNDALLLLYRASVTAAVPARVAALVGAAPVPAVTVGLGAQRLEAGRSGSDDVPR